MCVCVCVCVCVYTYIYVCIYIWVMRLPRLTCLPFCSLTYPPLISQDVCARLLLPAGVTLQADRAPCPCTLEKLLRFAGRLLRASRAGRARLDGALASG